MAFPVSGAGAAVLAADAAEFVGECGSTKAAEAPSASAARPPRMVGSVVRFIVRVGLPARIAVVRWRPRRQKDSRFAKTAWRWRGFFAPGPCRRVAKHSADCPAT